MKKKKNKQKHAPLQDSVRGFIREISVAMFLQIQIDIYIYKQKKKVIIVVTLILLTNHQFYQNIEVIICTQFDN